MRIRDFVGIVRELSFTEIRHEAMIPPRILVVAQNYNQGVHWGRLLFGNDASKFVDVVDTGELGADPLSYDAIVTIGPLGREQSRRWSNLYKRANEEMALVEVNQHQSTAEESLHWIRRKICDLSRDRAVAFGRYFPTMRTAATSEVVADTSRVNAQFAALSNIPALIPVFGNILAAGADFIVLTKNQLMMMYRIAAIYERDLNSRWRIYSELAPVVGAGLVWRTAARQLAALIPFALGAIPKVTIAYAGTYAIGKAACVYYEHGDKLSAEELDDVYREAIETFRQVRHRIAGERHEKAVSPKELTAQVESSG